MWTLIRLLLEEQSDLGPLCLQKWLKITSRWQSRRQLLWLAVEGLVHDKTDSDIGWLNCGPQKNVISKQKYIDYQESSYFQSGRSFATISGFQGEVLFQILDFPMYLYIFTSPLAQDREVSQLRETFYPKLLSRMTPGLHRKMTNYSHFSI